MIEIKEPEYICPICAKKFTRYKALHGHMTFSHRAEYAARGYSLNNYGITLNPYERIVREINKAGTVVETAAGPETETR